MFLLLCFLFFFFMLLRPPRPTLFPYTTLFRSAAEDRHFFLHPGVDPVAIARALATGSTQIGRDTSELQSLRHLVCRLLLEKKKITEEQVTTIAKGLLMLDQSTAREERGNTTER